MLCSDSLGGVNTAEGSGGNLLVGGSGVWTRLLLWVQELVLVWLRRWLGGSSPVCSDFPEAWRQSISHIHILHQFRDF